MTFFPSTWCTMDRGSPERSRVGGLISCPLSLVSVCTHSQTIPPTHHFSSIYPPSLCECSLSLLSSSPSISMYQSSIPVTLHVSIPPPLPLPFFLSLCLNLFVYSYFLLALEAFRAVNLSDPYCTPYICHLQGCEFVNHKKKKNTSK